MARDLKGWSYGKEQKKQLNFVLSASSPWADGWIGRALCGVGFGDPSVNASCVNLSDIPPQPGRGAGKVAAKPDAFRLSYNAIWAGRTNEVPGFPALRRQFGIPIPLRRKYPTAINLYKEQAQYGYGLRVGVPQLDPGGDLNSVFTTDASDRGVDVPQYWLQGHASRQSIGPAPLLGTPTPTIASTQHHQATSITGSRQTEQKFVIMPAVGWDLSRTLRTQLSIESAPLWWTERPEWNNFVLNNVVGDFEDLSFEMWWPFPLYQVDKGASHIKNIHVDIKPSFNFSVPEYEFAISQDTPATLLPNLYVFASEMDKSFLDRDDSRFKQHIDLHGRINEIFVDVINEKGEKIGEKDKGQYFEKWTRAWNGVTKPISTGAPQLDALATRYKNLVFPMSNLNLIKDNQGKEKLFPMHIKIDFSTDMNTKFADAMRDAKISTALIKEMVDGDSRYWSTEKADYKFAGWPQREAAVASSEPRQLVEGPGKLPVRAYKDTHIFDLAKWIDKTMEGTDINPFGHLLDTRFDGIFLGPLKDEVAVAADSRFKFFVALMMAEFRYKVGKIVDAERRTFKDLLRGSTHDGPKLAYSETVVYRIERFNSTDEGASWDSSGEPNVWFPNSSEIDVLSYVDTQIKYGASYRYRIWAYQMVVGNKYQYKMNMIAPMGNADEFWARLCLFDEPSIKLVEVPYYDSIWDYPKGIKMVDSPPVPPDVNIVPYVGADDKILVWLNSNVGDYWLPDIRILSTDDISRNSLEHRDNENNVLSIPVGGWNNNNISDTLIHFKSDDHIEEFEIFRLSKRPKKFSDFTDATRWSISVPCATAGAWVDKTIRPNKKYYYIFRAKDNHGHVSNPTAVYEVELVKDSENVYSLVNTIDMSLDPDRQVMKSGRKFIQIKPSLLQSTLDEDYLDNHVDGQTILGSLSTDPEDIFEETTPSVWFSGNDNVKKFKIRINSKKTGKKFDINVKFRIQAAETRGTLVDESCK